MKRMHELSVLDTRHPAALCYAIHFIGNFWCIWKLTAVGSGSRHIIVIALLQAKYAVLVSLVELVEFEITLPAYLVEHL